MIARASGGEHSFMETGQPQSSDLARRPELKRVWVKADIGITILWHRHGNNLINCTEISLMNSYVVISMRSNSRMSFSFLMGQHSCSFGRLPTLFSPAALHRFARPPLPSEARHEPGSLSPWAEPRGERVWPREAGWRLLWNENQIKRKLWDGFLMRAAPPLLPQISGMLLQSLCC